MPNFDVSIRTRVFVIVVFTAGLWLSWGASASAGGPLRDVEPARSSEAPAVAWPLLGEADTHPRELAILGYQERGALRLRTARSLAAPVLHLVAVNPAPRLEAQRPDFVGARGLEFYGLAAGIRHGFLEDGGCATPVMRFEVRRGEMTVIELPELAAQSRRTVRVVDPVGPIQGVGSVFADHGEFGVLLPWDGAPIALQSPLHDPRRLAIGFAGDGKGRVRLGTSTVLSTTKGDLDLPLRRGTSHVRLHPGAQPKEPFGIALTAGLQVTRDGRPFATQQILAAMLPDEFAVPPRAHTWAKVDPGEALTITDVPDGPLRVGVGLERRARYVLWREVDADPDGLVVGVVAPSPRPESPTGERVLPPWIRSVGLTTLADPGPCVEQPLGPGECWDVVEGAGVTCRRRLGWRDGVHIVHASTATIALPPPPDPSSVVSVAVQVVVPHAIRGDGVIYDYGAKSAWPDQLPAMPDGLLNAMVRFAGTQPPRMLYGVIEGGRLAPGADRWLTERDCYADRAELKFRVEDPTGAPAAGTRIFLETGAQAGTCDAGGRLTLLLDRVRRLPALACLRFDEVGFTHHVFGSGQELLFRAPAVDGVPLTWSLLDQRLGVSLTDCGFESVMIGRHPRGEACRLGRGQTGPAVRTDDVLEFAAEAEGVDLWSWSRGCDVLPVSRLWAQVVINSRTTGHIVHLTLPAAEMRFRMPAESRRVVRVAAPATIGVLSITESGGNDRKLLVDEGVTIELRPSDVVVIEYDK